MNEKTELLIVIVATMAIVYWTVCEAQKYFTSGQSDDDELAYTQKRFLRRLTVSLTLLVIMAMLKLRHLTESFPTSLMLAYYAGCLALVLLLFLLALADLAESTRQLREARQSLLETSLAALNKDLAKASSEQEKQKAAKGEQGRPPANRKQTETENPES